LISIAYGSWIRDSRLSKKILSLAWAVMCLARVEVQAAMNKQKGPLFMRMFFLLLHLQSFHAIDFWQTDYYAGNLQHGSANAASDVCDSMVSWGGLTVFHGHIADCDGSFSAAATICRARYLYKGDNSIGASLLLSHNKHLLEIVNRSSLETAKMVLRQMSAIH
jgi:hypothetical protein